MEEIDLGKLSRRKNEWISIKKCKWKKISTRERSEKEVNTTRIIFSWKTSLKVKVHDKGLKADQDYDTSKMSIKKMSDDLDKQMKCIVSDRRTCGLNKVLPIRNTLHSTWFTFTKNWKFSG